MIQREREYDQNVMVNIFTVIKKLSRQICEHGVDTKEATDEKITVVRFFWLTLEEEKSRIQTKQNSKGFDMGKMKN